LRKAAVSFVMSVCPSVRPYGTIRLLRDRFSWNFVHEDCRENSSSIKTMTRITENLHADPCSFMVILRWIPLKIKKKVLDRSYREPQNTFYVQQPFFKKKSWFLQDNVGACVRTRQAIGDKIMRRMCRVPDNWGENKDTYIWYLLFVHGNSGYANAPRNYVITYVACLVNIISGLRIVLSTGGILCPLRGRFTK